MFCIVWIAVFGGLTVQLQTSGTFDIWNGVNTAGMQSTIFYILNTFPLEGPDCIVCGIHLYLLLHHGGPCGCGPGHHQHPRLSVDDEASNKIKIVMGVIMGVIAYLLVASGGVNSVKGMWNIVGFPISVLLILVVVSVFRNAAKCEARMTTLS